MELKINEWKGIGKTKRHWKIKKTLDVKKNPLNNVKSISLNEKYELGEINHFVLVLYE